MASIKARTNKDGEITSFLITVSLGRDPETQKKIIETTSFTPTAKTPAKARKEAESFAVIFEKEVREGKINTDGDKITFSQFVKFYEKNVLESRVMKHTMTQRVAEEYSYYFRKHVIQHIGHLKLSKIKAPHIDEIVNTLIAEGYAPKTIHKIFNAVRSVFTYAYKKEYIRENPCDRCDPLPKIERRDLNIWTENQVQTFFKILDAEMITTYRGHVRTLQKTGEKYSVPDYTETHSNSLMFRLFYRLSYYGSFRRGEICALTWNDIDFDHNVIRIRHSIERSDKDGQTIKDPKTVSGIRDVTLPAHVFDMLKDWHEEQKKICETLGSAWKGTRDPQFDNNYVFIQDDGSLINIMSPSDKFRKLIRRYNATCENPEDRLPEIRLHDLRHTGLSHLVGHGVDIVEVSKRAGHSKPSMTLDVYSHALPQNDRKASDLLETLVPDKHRNIIVLHGDMAENY